jgi:hypothetical protein
VDSVRRFVAVEPNNPDERKIPIVLVEVQSVSENEFVRDVETSVVDWDFGFASLALIEQGTNLKAAGTSGLQ